MEEIYTKILELARPYYEKGRVYDLDQIDWMTKQANSLADKLNLDKKILMPLIILHDVGYSFIQNKNPNIKDQESKKIHLEEGVKIARKILEQINYNKELTEQILYFISVHDNWLFGDDQPYKESKLLALFNDLDFLYAQSSYEAFKLGGDSMGIPVKKMYDFWMNDEKLTRRPFCCAETKELFENLMEQRKRELLSIS